MGSAEFTGVYLLLGRWLAVNLEFLGNGVVLAAAILSVMGKDTLSPGIVGLVVSHSLQVRVLNECNHASFRFFAIFCLI